MYYKVTIQNQTDPKDKFEMEADAAIVFMGKVDLKDGAVAVGMGYAGHTKVLEEVIKSIPFQITEFLQQIQSGLVKTKGEQSKEPKKGIN
jgi:hypothetical protein